MGRVDKKHQMKPERHGIYFYFISVMNYFSMVKNEQPRICLYEWDFKISKKKSVTRASKKHAQGRYIYYPKNKVINESVYHCPTCPEKSALCSGHCFPEFHKKFEAL